MRKPVRAGRFAGRVGPQTAALGLLLACTQACASLGAHYVGTSTDGTQVQLYLDGGKLLGPQGDFHVLQTDIRIQQKRRAVKTADSCRYIYNPAHRAHDRIECAERAGARLSGVVYTLDQQLFQDSKGETQDMRCVQRCSRQVPRVLQLEADEDNG